MKIKLESVCEHKIFCNEKETLNLLSFSTSPSWKEVGQQLSEREREKREQEREREKMEEEESTCFEDWELFCTYGKHLITGYNDGSILMRIITINS